jgi:transcriptional regulator with XRE-family HTH domain
MTAADLAIRSGVGLATIKRLEAGDGLPPAHAKTIDQLTKALESAGIEFIGTPDDNPGVRLVNRK